MRGKAKAAAKLSTARINCYEGSVRAGKTIGSLVEWIEFCKSGPPGTFLMAGRTERTVINNLVLPMQEMLGPDRVKINRGTGTVNIAGREVLIVGAANELARTKIQGLTLAAAYVDEVATTPESFFNMLTSRLSVKGAKLWCTCNPEGPGHWFKTKWLDRATLWVRHDGTIIRKDPADYADDDPARPINLHRVSFTLDDNAHNLDPEYVTNTKAMYSGVWFLRMILGQWTVADGVIYDKFEPGSHVVPYDQLPTMQRVIGLGVDYGTTNPTAGILLGIGADNRLYLIDEWSPARGTDSELSDQLSEWLAENRYEPEWIYLDPAAENFSLQLYKDRIGRVADATNSVLPGIKLVAALFSTDQLRVSDRCTRLLEELPGYVWDAKASREKGVDKPIKLNDHFCDAMRYAIASAFPIWDRYLPQRIEHPKGADDAAAAA
ncbi:PBSX family phage terminase large subunit [Rhodococcus maanshanensis]|nr:PBSX family phage terminase large subunit [Rhodococcus maanshanensis]